MIIYFYGTVSLGMHDVVIALAFVVKVVCVYVEGCDHMLNH